MKKYIAVIIAVVVLAAFAMPAFAAEEAAAPEGPPYKVGMMAKNIEAKDPSGNAVDLLTVGDKDKKAIVFTNTACSACKQALGIVQSLVPGKADLIVVATDFGPYERIDNYKNSNNFGGSWFQDEEFATPEAFGFGFTPAVVVLQKDGKVLLSNGGYNKRKAAAFKAGITDALK